MTDFSINIRNATAADASQLFYWRNDPETRRMSFSMDEISWESHKDWFEQILRHPGREIYIGEILPDRIPFGELRFDILENRDTEINIVISPDWRRKGLGRILILNGIQTFSSRHPDIHKIIALIKPENTASKKLFEHCGFSYVDTHPVEGGGCSETWILDLK